MPPLGVSIEELRPDHTYVQMIVNAVCDIRICEKIFDGWAIQLDKCAVNSLSGHVSKSSDNGNVEFPPPPRNQRNES
jgi:hypothetical protein